MLDAGLPLLTSLFCLLGKLILRNWENVLERFNSLRKVFCAFQIFYSDEEKDKNKLKILKCWFLKFFFCLRYIFAWNFQFFTEHSCICQLRNLVFATNSNFLIPISLQHDGVNLWYFRLFDIPELYSLYCLRSTTLSFKK